MTSLDRLAWDPGGVGDRIQPRLAPGAQLELVLEHPAQKLASLDLQPVLEFAVLTTVCFHVLQPAQHRIELLPRAGKTIHRSTLARRIAAITPKTARTIAPRHSGRQDFTGRRVKFPRTGAKIGDHRGHLRGRR